MPRMQGNGTGNAGGEYFFIDWNLVSQNIPGNYSTISWAAYWHFNSSDRQLDNGHANLGDVTRWANGGRIYNYSGNFTTRDMLLASGSFDIGHNSDGTKTLNVSGGVTGYSGQRSEGSGSWGLTTIPRYATITSTTGDITDEAATVSIGYTNPYGGSVTAKLYIRPLGSSGSWTQIANVTGYASGSNFAGSVDWASVRSVLANHQQGQLLYRVTNGVGDTDSSRILTIINANPVFSTSNISYEDIDSAVVAITTDDQNIVQNQSSLRAAFTAASALKSATITSYKVTLNTDIRTFSSAQTAIDYGAVNLAVDTPITIEVTDSRGNKTTVNKTISILPWQLPSAVLTIGRVNNYEDDTEVKAAVTIASVDSKNSIEVLKVRYKKTSDVSYSETAMTNNVLTTLDLDKLFEWNLQVVVTDKFGTTTYIALVSKGIPIMFFDTGMLSMGIGMFPTKDEALQVEDGYLEPIMSKVYPIGRVVFDVTGINPQTLPQHAGQTWTVWGTGRVPVGIDASQSEFNTIEETGGAKTHTLTAPQMPIHGLYFSHHGDENGSVVRGAGATNGSYTGGTHSQYKAPPGTTSGAGSNRQMSWSFGGDQAHNNLQPYITVYMWKRTA